MKLRKSFKGFTEGQLKWQQLGFNSGLKLFPCPRALPMAPSMLPPCSIKGQRKYKLFSVSSLKIFEKRRLDLPPEKVGKSSGLAPQKCSYSYFP